MIDFPHLDEICRPTDSKIIMLVADGLGGVPHPETGKSELETAHIPNLNALARQSACALTTPVLPGISPGSGPGHLALFGYDPVKYLIGRGVLEALGIDVNMKEGEVAARGNFCTIDSQGLLIDRRAGRIPTEESAPLCKLLDKIDVPGVEISVYPVKEYRFVLLLRGKGLSEELSGTDPEKLGVPPLPAQAKSDGATKTAQYVNAFLKKAAETLKGRSKANMVLVRGFSQLPELPNMGQVYKLNPAAIAAYPMYRGLTKLLGMKVIPTGTKFQDELDTLKKHYNEHDFFYIHYKPADAAGEDGNFDAKVKTFEELDSYIPQLLELKPDVLVVAGDHATPSIMAAHGWQAVPTLIHSPLTKGDGVPSFSERNCRAGSIGLIPAINLMFLVLAHAGKLAKFGP